MKEKKLLSLLLALIMVFSLLPAGARAAGGGTDSITAYVTMSYEGAVIAKDGKQMYAVSVTLEAGKTAEDAIAAAVQDCGFTYERTSGYGFTSDKDFSTYPSSYGGTTAAYIGTYKDCSGTLASSVFINGRSTSGGTLTDTLTSKAHIDVLLYDYKSDYSGTPKNYLYFSNGDTFCESKTVHTGWTMDLSVLASACDPASYGFGSGETVSDASIAYYMRSGDGKYTVASNPFTTTGTIYAVATKAGCVPAVAIIDIVDHATNTAPALRSGTSTTISVSAYVSKPYTLDLSAIFADDEGDPLTYTVRINSAEAISANASYRYTPTGVGDTTFIFTANDGLASSAEAYTVTLHTAAAPTLDEVYSSLYSYYQAQLAGKSFNNTDLAWAIADMSAAGYTVPADIKQAYVDYAIRATA